VTLAPDALLFDENVPPVADHETAFLDVSFATVAETESVCVTARPARLGETVIPTAPEEIVNISFADLLLGGVLESATWNVMAVLVTACVGVPLIAPDEALNVRPGGRVPLPRDHIYGGVPPLAAKTALYATPVCPVGSEEVEIVSAAGEGPPALPELEPPPQALKRPVVIIRTMARKEFRIGFKGRERRVIGFMGLEVAILSTWYSRGINLY
jgi:hypothetical protein